MSLAVANDSLSLICDYSLIVDNIYKTFKQSVLCN